MTILSLDPALDLYRVTSDDFYVVVFNEFLAGLSLLERPWCFLHHRRGCQFGRLLEILAEYLLPQCATPFASTYLHKSE